jgi:hypothetical protein
MLRQQILNESANTENWQEIKETDVTTFFNEFS